jgi:hypothetical protein
MVTAESQVQESDLLDETIAMAETVLATIEFVEIEEPPAGDGAPVVIETAVTNSASGFEGTFVVTEGADVLGCSGGSLVGSEGPSQQIRGLDPGIDL